MTGNVHHLHGRPRGIANFTRVGFSEHRQVEHLPSAGVMSATRFVIEAANFKRQTSLIRTPGRIWSTVCKTCPSTSCGFAFPGLVPTPLLLASSGTFRPSLTFTPLASPSSQIRWAAWRLWRQVRLARPADLHIRLPARSGSLLPDGSIPKPGRVKVSAGRRFTSRGWIAA